MALIYFPSVSKKKAKKSTDFHSLSLTTDDGQKLNANKWMNHCISETIVVFSYIHFRNIDDC